MSDRAPLVGIDLGGTNIKTALVSPEAEVIAQTEVPTEASKGPDVVIDRIMRSAHAVVEKDWCVWEDVAAVGIGSPGFLDSRTGVIIHPPNLPGWRNVPLRQRLSDGLGKPVALENDANAAAWGEYWAGAGKGARSQVMFTLGTGIGGAIILQDDILRGENDLAGELGHMIIDPDGPLCSCGQRGCLESFASATATVRRFREAIQGGADSVLAGRVRAGDPVDTRDMFEAALEGDALSRTTIEDTGRYMGIGINNLIMTVNPQVFLLAGGLSKAGDMLLDAVKEQVNRMLPEHVAGKADIRIAQLGGLAGAIGAAGCALHTYVTSA